MDGYKTGLGLYHEVVWIKIQHTLTFPFMVLQNTSLLPNVPLWRKINYS